MDDRSLRERVPPRRRDRRPRDRHRHLSGRGHRGPVGSGRRDHHRRHLGLDVVAAHARSSRRARPRPPRSTRSSTAPGSRSSPATTTRTVVYPDRRGMVQAGPDTRADAKAAVQHLDRERRHGDRQLARRGDRACSRRSKPTQRHAILLTDGQDETETPRARRTASMPGAAIFQCDCRGVGARLGGQRAPRDRVRAARLGRHHRRARARWPQTSAR